MVRTDASAPSARADRIEPLEAEVYPTGGHLQKYCLISNLFFIGNTKRPPGPIPFSCAPAHSRLPAKTLWARQQQKNVGLQDDLVQMASDRGLTAFLYALTFPKVSDRKPCASKHRFRVGVAWWDSGLPTTGMPWPSLVLQHPGGSGIGLTSMASAERAHVSRHNQAGTHN